MCISPYLALSRAQKQARVRTLQRRGFVRNLVSSVMPSLSREEKPSPPCSPQRILLHPSARIQQGRVFLLLQFQNTEPVAPHIQQLHIHATFVLLLLALTLTTLLSSVLLKPRKRVTRNGPSKQAKIPINHVFIL